MMQDDPLDPAAKKTLMDGLMGPPPPVNTFGGKKPTGISGAASRAFDRALPGMQGRVDKLVDAAGGPGSLAPPPAPVSAPGLDAGFAPGPPDPALAGASLEKKPFDNSGFNSKGYAKPQWVPESYGNATSGYDSAKWNDANYWDPKYTIGRIGGQEAYQDGDFSDADLQAYIADIDRAYPGAAQTFNGKDKISIDGGRSYIDAIEKAGTNDPRQRKPAFMPDQDVAPDGTVRGPAGGGMGGGAFGMLSPTLGGDPQAAIQEALSSISQPQILELIQRLQQGA